MSGTLGTMGVRGQGLAVCCEVPEALRPHCQVPERGGAGLADKWQRPRTPTLLLAACVLLIHSESETRDLEQCGL